MIPCRPFRRELCDSAKQGRLCCDDLCHTGGETLCGFCLIVYQELLDEDEECTCDMDGDEDTCPAHYHIDDGSDEDEHEDEA